MTFSKNLDDAYRQAASADRVPPGRYRARVVSAEYVEATTGSEGLRLKLEIIEGRFEGRVLVHDFWLNGGALSISKGNLDLLGFGGLAPSQILAFRDFDQLPAVKVRVVEREYEGRVFPEIKSIMPDAADRKSGVPNGDEPGEGVGRAGSA